MTKMTTRMAAPCKSKFFMSFLAPIHCFRYGIWGSQYRVTAFVMLLGGKYKLQGIRNIKLLISLPVPLSDILKTRTEG